MLIPFRDLFEKYQVNPKGILHIGAHFGQEMNAYREQTDAPVVFVEAMPETYRELCRRMAYYDRVKCIHACISDVDGQQVTFNISNNEGQSSSLLDFGTHTSEHPTVVFTKKIRLQTTTVRSMLRDHHVPAEELDFINIDLQGAELMALRSMDLRHVKYAYIEVNQKHLYRDCPLVEDIDAHLADYGLRRVETSWTPHGWGDAFYIKSVPVVLQVPKEFQPLPIIKYPVDNHVEFERWYMEHHTPGAGRTYLPIMWTAYYCRHKYGKDAGAIATLQKFIDSLDPSIPYYTIVQYDDGILNDLSRLDIKVFSMSGKPMDYTLPLICQEHQPLPHAQRDIFCNFVGRVTHAIRADLFQFKSQPGWFITDKHMNLRKFSDVLNRSVFTLCPRGYGPTSFRIMEAMQYGSIPVYISDQHIVPHGIDFEKYGVLVNTEHINDLPRVLASVNVAEKQEGVRKYYKTLYTYPSNKAIIDDHCRTV